MIDQDRGICFIVVLNSSLKLSFLVTKASCGGMVATALGILSVLMSPGFHSAHIRRLEEGFKSLKLTKTETIKLDLRVIS